MNIFIFLFIFFSDFTLFCSRTVMVAILFCFWVSTASYVIIGELISDIILSNNSSRYFIQGIPNNGVKNLCSIFLLFMLTMKIIFFWGHTVLCHIMCFLRQNKVTSWLQREIIICSWCWWNWKYCITGSPQG